VDFTDLKMTLKAAQEAVMVGDAIIKEATAAVTVNYGVFLQHVVDFLIIAFAIFMAIKSMNSIKKKKEEAPAAPPAPSKEEQLLTEIRDLLKNRS
jgi:large conductance mechanosensitive channel